MSNWHLVNPAAMRTAELDAVMREIPKPFRGGDWPTTNMERKAFIREAQRLYRNSPRSDHKPVGKSFQGITATEVNQFLRELPPMEIV